MLAAEKTRPFIYLISIFATFICLLGIVYYNFPNLDDRDREHFKYPRNLDDAKQLGRVLSHYKDQHYYLVRRVRRSAVCLLFLLGNVRHCGCLRDVTIFCNSWINFLVNSIRIPLSILYCTDFNLFMLSYWGHRLLSALFFVGAAIGSSLLPRSSCVLAARNREA